MANVRRLAVLALALAAVLPGPGAAARPCSAATHRCCCDPGSCGCPGEAPAGDQADGCACGPAAPAPPAGEPVGSTLSGPGRELAAQPHDRPAPAVSAAGSLPCRQATSRPQAVGPPPFLVDCALLI